MNSPSVTSIQQDYESIAYPHYVHPLADTARLAALGAILGLGGAAPPGQARVLDIGCGSGTHLLALAARSPGSQFVGIDFSGPDIVAAQALAEQAGLRNVRFEQADLLTWQPPASADDRFDYVIAYGFFSWVPDEVKARLLQVIAQSLAPQGIACVSYMTYPGCKQPEALRDLLRLHTQALAEPAAKVAAAHATLDVLDRAWRASPAMPHATHLRSQVQHIRGKGPHDLLLDDLGAERDPCYLLQFAAWAAEHGLRYLGDSEFHSMLPENLPADAAGALAALKLDRLNTEQMLDYISNRSFRCSLLVGPQAAVAEGLHAEALRGLCLTPHLQPAGVARRGAAEARFKAEDDPKLTLRGVPLVALAQALAAHPSACTPWPVLLAEAQGLAGRDFSADEQARLCHDMLVLLGRRHIDVSALPFHPAATPPQQPRLAAPNAAFAQQRSLLVTPRLLTLQLTVAEQALCALLDGTRTRAALRQAPAGAALGQKLDACLDALWRSGCTPG